MEYDKFDELYDNLKEDGYVERSREHFKAFVYAPGEEGYRNRKALYENMREDGYVDSPTYEEFARRLGLHAVKSTGSSETAAPSPKAAVAPSDADGWESAPLMPGAGTPETDGEGAAGERWEPTPSQRAVMNARVEASKRAYQAASDETAERSRNLAEYNSGSAAILGVPAKGRMAFNPESGKVEQTYITPDGVETTDRLGAEDAARGYRAERFAVSLPGRIQAARRRVSELERSIGERMRALSAEAAERDRGSGLTGSVIGGIVNAERGYIDYGGFVESAKNDRELNSLRLSLRQAEESLRQMENARHQQTRGGGGSRFWDSPLVTAARVTASLSPVLAPVATALRVADAASGSEFTEDFVRGTWQAVADTRAWDFGYGDLRDSMTSLAIARKAESGRELTDAERSAMEDIALNQAVMAQFGDLGTGYRWGDIAGTSLSFMKDFFIFGSLGEVPALFTRGMTKIATKAGASMASEVAKRAAKRGLVTFVKKEGMAGVGALVREQAAPWAVKALGTTADDLLLRAPMMASTVQGMSTASKIVNEKLGGVEYDPATETYRFEDGSSWSRAAWEAGADQVIENFSEMWGAHLPGLTEVSKTFGARNLTAAVLRSTREGAGTAMSMAATFLRRAGVNGYLGEVGEEYYGQVWRTWLGLSSAYDPETGENNFKSGQFHWDIWGGMALSVGMTGGGAVVVNSGLRYGGKAVDYYAARHAVDRADRLAGTALTAGVWDPMRTIIDATDNANIGALAEQVWNDRSMTDAQKAAVLDYMEAEMVARGRNLRDFVTRMPEAEHAGRGKMADAYTEGMAIDTAEDRNRARMGLRYRGEKLCEALGLAANADPARALAAIYGTDDIDAIITAAYADADLTEAARSAIEEYLVASNRYNGMAQASREAVEAEAAVRAREVDERSDRSDAGNPVVRPAVMKLGDERVCILGGGVSMLPDGTMVDIANSDRFVIIRKEDGSVETADAADILRLEEPRSAADVKAEVAAEARAALTAEIRAQINGTVKAEPGDVVPVMAGGQVVEAEVRANDGSAVTVTLHDGTEAAFTLREIQALSDRARMEAFRAEMGEENAREEAEGAEAPADFAAGDALAFPAGTDSPLAGAEARIVEIDRADPSAPRYVVEYTRPDGSTRVAYMTAEELAAANAAKKSADGALTPPAESVSSRIENNNDDGNRPQQDNGGSVGPQGADAGGRVADDSARGVASNRDRGHIRVYEEGLGSPRDEHSEYSERARRDAEAERLVAIAKANGEYFDKEQQAALGDKKPKRSGESEVYINKAEGKVYKVKDPYAKSPMKPGVAPEDAVYEHLVHNKYFPETAYGFEGVSDEYGDLRIVLSQDYVDGVDNATDEQIEAALAEKGLYPEGKYRYGNDEISVTDVTGDNAIVGADGKVYFIDPVIDFKKPVSEILGPAEEPVPKTEESVPDSTENAVPGAETVPENAVSVENGQQTAPEEAPEVSDEMPMVEVKGKRGEPPTLVPDFLAVSPARGRRHLYEERGYSEAVADAFVAKTIEKARKDLAKLAGTEPEIGTDLAEYDRAKARWDADAEAARRTLGYWEEVRREQLRVSAQRDMADVAAAQEAEAARRRALAQEGARQREEAARAAEDRAARPAQYRRLMDAWDAPASLREHIARYLLSGVRLRWVDKGSTRGLGHHLFGGKSAGRNTRDEYGKFMWLVDDRAGISPEAAAEEIAQAYYGDYENDTDHYTEVFAALLDMLASQKGPAGMWATALEERRTSTGSGLDMFGFTPQEREQYFPGMDDAEVQAALDFYDRYGVTGEEYAEYAASHHAAAELIMMADAEYESFLRNLAGEIADEYERRKNEQRNLTGGTAPENGGGGALLPGQRADDRGRGAETRQGEPPVAGADGAGPEGLRGAPTPERKLVDDRITERRERIRAVLGERYSLSEEPAGNGELLYQNADGRTDLAHIDEDIFDKIGLDPVPFKLTETMGFHVYNNHAKELGLNSMDDAIDFILDIINNADHVRLGRDNSYIFAVENGRGRIGKRAVTIVINNETGGFMGIRTSGYERIKNLKERPLLWRRGADSAAGDVATPTVTTIKSQQGDERMGRTEGQSKGAEGVAGSAETLSNPETSDGKVNASPTEKQIGSGESSAQSVGNQRGYAEKVAAAEAETDTDPTEAQKEAGNYRKGHVTIGDFDITIEQPRGSVRRGPVDPATGKPAWETTMANTYGYIRGTESADGDHIDVFLHEDMDQWNGRKVFVVDQTNPDGSFDEHKVMLGFNDGYDAMRAYFTNYEEGWEKTHPGIRISEVSVEDFKAWAMDGYRKTKPFADYANVRKETAGIAARTEEDSSPNDTRLSAGTDVAGNAAVYEAGKSLLEAAGIEVEEVGSAEADAMLADQRNALRNAAKRRALDTFNGGNAQNSSDTGLRPSHQDPVVSFDDTANIQKELESLAKRYENISKEHTFIGDLARALGLRNNGNHSNYGTFEAKSGTEVRIRVSDHNAEVKNFADAGYDNGISIVISRKANAGLTNNGSAHIVEYYYNGYKLARADGHPLAEIARSLKQALYSGEFRDTTGLAERQEVNGGDTRLLRDTGGTVYGWTSGGKVYLNRDAMNPETPLHEYTHLWDLMAARENHRLWARGKELMMELPLWDEVLNDPNYADIRSDEDAVASEVHSRLAGKRGAEILEGMVAEARDAGVVETAEAVSLAARVREWLREMFDSLRDTLGKWNRVDLKGLTAEGFADLTLRDLAEGLNPNHGDRQLVTLHNISEEKLRKALGAGGLANPSMAVVKAGKNSHDGYGAITLVAPAAMADKRRGRNAGTWAGDAWTPTYPPVERDQDHIGRAAAVSAITEAVPPEMRGLVTWGWESHMSGGNESGLAYWFLGERGEAPGVSRRKRRFDKELAREVLGITGERRPASLDAAEASRLRDIYIREVMEGDESRYAEYLALSARSARERLGKPSGLLRMKAEAEIDMVERLGLLPSINGWVADIRSDERLGERADEYATSSEANRIITERGLAGEFGRWVEGLDARFGVRERLFAGYAPDGTRRYVANTVENASRIMRRQGRNASTGSGSGFGTFVASALEPMRSLGDMRKRSDRLRDSRGETEEFDRKWGDVYFDLAMKCQPDAERISDDYGFYRLNEAASEKAPAGYLKREYGIELGPEDSARLAAMVEAVREERPVGYFETKFERPVGFGEFAAAVVPEETDPELVDALRSAGGKGACV